MRLSSKSALLDESILWLSLTLTLGLWNPRTIRGLGEEIVDEIWEEGARDRSPIWVIVPGMPGLGLSLGLGPLRDAELTHVSWLRWDYFLPVALPRLYFGPQGAPGGKESPEGLVITHTVS